MRVGERGRPAAYRPTRRSAPECAPVVVAWRCTALCARGRDGVMARAVLRITKRGADRNYGAPVGRGKRDPRTCDHVGPVLAREAGTGYVAVCLMCDTVGPERETSKEARRALLELAGDRPEGD